MWRKFWIIFIVSGCVDFEETEDLEITNEISYASKFYFEKSDTSKYLVISEPWPGATLKKKYKLDKPLSRVVCTSTSHLPFIELLGMEETVVGFPNIDYVSSEVFRKRAEDDLLKDLGADGNINLEMLLSLNPDAVIAFDMGGEANSLDKIESSGIPVIYNSDFLEKTPLGRAEWIKFFGALFNKQSMADSIFRFIEAEYKELSEIGENFSEKPSVISGVVYGDTWFLPGGQNWSSVFFENAGAKYLYNQDTTTGWLELSFESVFEMGYKADYWIGTSSLNSKSDMLGQDGRYGSFEAFKNDRVYNYSKRIGPNGGYDFFESGYSRPDLILGDLIKILHPKSLPGYETIYFQKLK
jgi:iron complex transport system substrate-binding protein